MPLFEALRLALDTIWVQKLKSFFTLLGVTIGVTFLIAVVSIVEGMGTYMERDVVGKLMGVNSFELRHRPYINMGDVDDATISEWRRRPRVLVDDVAPVAASLPEGTRWYMLAQDRITISSQYARPRAVDAYAIDGDYFEVKRMTVDVGRLFAPQELEAGTNVVVIGKDIEEHFFPGVSPLGRELKIGGLPYTVIGIAEKQGSALGQSFDKFVVAPFKSPMHRLLNRKPRVIDAVVVQSPTAAAMTGDMERVRQVMRGRRGLRPSQPDNFDLSTSESALAFWTKLKGYLVLAGVALPAIGLVVGSIVIMNIMLVAVAERTREIGVRKSLGAKRRDILAQFLIEAATLSTLGAALGIALGIALSQTIAALTPLPATVAPWSIVVGVLLGAGVGIIAGVYPASRASRLDPITALRQE